MRMFCRLWQKRGFDEKLTVLWRSCHCRRFHSVSIVNYTENWPLPVSRRSIVNKIEKVADTMRMFSQLWQKRGFYEKLLVLWRSGHWRRFHSAPIANCTENRPFSVSQRRGVRRLRRWQIPCGCSVQGAKVGSTCSALTGGKNESSVNGWFHLPWAEHEALTSAGETV